MFRNGNGQQCRGIIQDIRALSAEIICMAKWENVCFCNLAQPTLKVKSNWAEYETIIEWTGRLNPVPGRFKKDSTKFEMCFSYVCVCVCIESTRCRHNFTSLRSPRGWHTDDSAIISQLLYHCPLQGNTIKWQYPARQGRNPYKSHHLLHWNIAKYDFIRHNRQGNDGGT